MISLVLLTAVLLASSCAQQMEAITGTVYCNNEFSLYVNGELIATDPVPGGPHNAVNVTFNVESGKDITFAIDAKDLASDTTGLEADDRCIGTGGLRAMFSNGVVTNSSWVCMTYLYGPLNWKNCFGAQMVRDQSDQLVPACLNASVPPLEGCITRLIPKPNGWEMPEFDESHWAYAIEWPENFTNYYGLPPTGCTNPSTIISTDVDSNGVNLTCPANLNWGAAKLIWGSDIDLDNHLLCRYTVRVATGSAVVAANIISIMIIAISIAASVIIQ
jgi:hypothetical protein